MNKLFAAVVIAAALGMAGTSANAGILDAVIKSAPKPIIDRGSDGSVVKRQPKPAPGSYAYLGNKPYMECLRGKYVFARNDEERRMASNQCTKKYYY
jgi:hypothetical protein